LKELEAKADLLAHDDGRCCSVGEVEWEEGVVCR
jgi:hypothetical protein